MSENLSKFGKGQKFTGSRVLQTLEQVKSKETHAHTHCNNWLKDQDQKNISRAAREKCITQKGNNYVNAWIFSSNH